jgi:hypothetical protein
LGLVFLQLVCDIKFESLCDIINSNCLNKDFHVLDAKLVPNLIKNIHSQYIFNSYPYISVMLTDCQNRKTANDILSTYF